MTSLQNEVTASVRPALLAVLAAVTLVLIIACVNVTNLLLARGAARRTEMAMRAALGAGPRRLVRQLITESVLLAIIGGTLGMVVAATGLRWLIAIAPPGLSRRARSNWIPGIRLRCRPQHAGRPAGRNRSRVSRNTDRPACWGATPHGNQPSDDAQVACSGRDCARPCPAGQRRSVAAQPSAPLRDRPGVRRVPRLDDAGADGRQEVRQALPRIDSSNSRSTRCARSPAWTPRRTRASCRSAATTTSTARTSRGTTRMPDTTCSAMP